MKIFFAFSISLSLFVVAPNISSAQCSGKSLKVEIEGNNKTKESVVRRLAGIQGECVPDKGIDRKTIEQNLLNARLFSQVEVEVREETGVTVVHISVKEKWTIFPIPTFSTRSEETGGGLMILDTNLLGRKKIFMAGASFSNLGEKYEGLYVDDAVWGSRWVIIARWLFSDRELQRFDDEEQIYSYRRNYDMVLAIFGRKITEHFAPGVGFKYFYRGAETVKPYYAPPDGGPMHSVMLNVRYNNTNYFDYYDKGISILAVFEQTTPMLGASREVGKFGIDSEFDFPLWKFLTRSYLKGAWTWGPDEDFLDYYRAGGDVGSRGLPSYGIWVSDLVAVAEEIEYPILRHKLGTLTEAQFIDTMFTLENDRVRAYPAVGLGLRAYIKKLAIPAVGFDAAYSLRNYAWHFTAYVGQVF